MSKEPTIPAAEVERRAREVIGDKLERVEFRARVRRSERIIFHMQSGTISLSNDSYADPDVVRKFALKLFDEMEETARTVAAQLTCEHSTWTEIDRDLGLHIDTETVTERCAHCSKERTRQVPLDMGDG